MGSILYFWQWKLAQAEQDTQIHDIEILSLLTWPLCMPPSAEGQQKKNREATDHAFVFWFQKIKWNLLFISFLLTYLHQRIVFPTMNLAM